MPWADDMDLASDDPIVRAREQHRRDFDAWFAANNKGMSEQEIGQRARLEAREAAAAELERRDIENSGLSATLGRILRSVTPTNVRAYVRALAGSTSAIDESFFKEDELQALRRAAVRGLGEFDDPNTRQGSRPSIQYRHYDPSANAAASIIEIVTAPDKIARSTIGRSVIERQANGDVVLVDHYDFTQPGYGPPLFKAAHKLGETMVPQGGGFPVRINLGNPKDWQE